MAAADGAGGLTVPAVVAQLCSSKAGKKLKLDPAAVTKGVEHSNVMFHCQPVWRGGGLQYRRDPELLTLEHTTLGQVAEMTGMHEPRGVPWSMRDFCAGGLDISTKLAHTHVGPLSSSAWPRAAAGDDGSGGEGEPADIDDWPKDRLLEWVRGRGRPASTSSTKPALRKLICGMCRTGQTPKPGSNGDDSALSVKALERARSEANHDVWKRIRGPGWKSGSPSERMTSSPALDTDTITQHFKDLKADTYRNRLGGQSRFVTAPQWRWSKPAAADGGKAGFAMGGMVKVMHFEAICVVGPSYASKHDSDLDRKTRREDTGHDGRKVYFRLLCLGWACDSTTQVMAIEDCQCLLPEDVVAGRGKCQPSKVRHCREHDRCLHARAAMLFFCSGSTDGACNWVRRSTSKAYEKSQPAWQLPLSSSGQADRDAGGDFQPATRHLRAPFQKRKRAEMERGTRSAVYGPALLSYMEMKERALDERAARINTEGSLAAVRYPIKQRRMMLPMDEPGLSHAELEALNALEQRNREDSRSRCSAMAHSGAATRGRCTKHLNYDRGAGGEAVVEMETHGVVVLTPDKRVDHQLAHSVASMDKNRASAAERVNIERCMREFRGDDGFDCTCALCCIDIADAEAQVARGLANLSRELHSWCAQTGTVVTRPAGSDAEEEML